MKSMVGFLFFLLFLGGLALVMIMGKDLAGKSADNPAIQLQRAQWRVTAIHGQEVPVESAITIAFSSDGAISGSAACNNYFGQFVVVGSELRFSGIGSTKKACQPEVMTLESTFLQVLGAPVHFKVGRYGLVLQTPAAKELIRFRAVAADAVDN